VWLSVSATTRPARPTEVQGEDYDFISAEEFSERRERGEFLEWAEIYGHQSATPREPLESVLDSGRDALVEVDIQGAEAIKRAVPEAILVFLETPSPEDLAARLRSRGTEDAEALSRRIGAAEQELRVRNTYDHIIVNDEIDAAVEAFVRILDEAPPSKG
jgi:guanylate kinase